MLYAVQIEDRDDYYGSAFVVAVRKTLEGALKRCEELAKEKAAQQNARPIYGPDLGPDGMAIERPRTYPDHCVVGPIDPEPNTACEHPCWTVNSLSESGEVGAEYCCFWVRTLEDHD